jgi:hypothetical protein
MGLWETVRAWFKTETADLGDAAKDLEGRVDADLSRRERQLNETPEQAIARIQAEADSGDEDSFAAVSEKIEAAAARAAAAAEAEAEAHNLPTEIDPEFLDRDHQPDPADDETHPGPSLSS